MRQLVVRSSRLLVNRQVSKWALQPKIYIGRPTIAQVYYASSGTSDINQLLKELQTSIDKTVEKAKKNLNPKKGSDGSAISKAIKEHCIKVEKAFNDMIVKLDETIKRNPQISGALNNLKANIEEAKTKLRKENPEITVSAQKVANQITVSYEVIGQEVKKFVSEINKKGGLKDDLYNHLKELLTYIDMAGTNGERSLSQNRGRGDAALVKAMKEHYVKTEKVLNDMMSKLDETIKKNLEITGGLKKLEETKRKLKEENPEMAANARMIGDQLKASYEVIGKEMEKIISEINRKGGLMDDLRKLIKEMHASIAKTVVETKKSLSLGESQDNAAIVKAIKEHSIEAEKVFNDTIVNVDETIKKNPEISEALKDLKAQIEESKKKLKENPEFADNAQKVADNLKAAYESVGKEMEKINLEVKKKSVHKDDFTRLIKNFIDKGSKASKDFQKQVEAAIEEVNKKKK